MLKLLYKASKRDELLVKLLAVSPPILLFSFMYPVILGNYMSKDENSQFQLKFKDLTKAQISKNIIIISLCLGTGFATVFSSQLARRSIRSIYFEKNHLIFNYGGMFLGKSNTSKVSVREVIFKNQPLEKDSKLKELFSPVITNGPLLFITWGGHFSLKHPEPKSLFQQIFYLTNPNSRLTLLKQHLT